ncbi:zinc finger protein 761-like isoform X2 [Euwallacea fornicatus]|uniref:zinc finger protein 761-like isoform X2 n=1 Tax=Euwallacea fornicatus TaxID=995702 RepID=UPI00338E1005
MSLETIGQSHSQFYLASNLASNSIMCQELSSAHRKLEEVLIKAEAFEFDEDIKEKSAEDLDSSVIIPLGSKRTKYKHNLLRHVVIHKMNPESPPSFKCEQCPYETHRIEYLKKHKNVHSDVQYKCGYCNFSTKFKTNLPKHMIRHKPAIEWKMFKCDECEFETKEKSGIKRHKLTHRTLEEVEHFSCTLCSFITKHQISFTNHMLKIHHRDKTEKHHCPECDFFTYHKVSLKNHILTHRKPGEVPMYKCPECEYETKNKQFLPNHMKIHLSNSPCPICNKMISQRGMPMHLKSHESEETKNKYKCKQCDYRTMYFGNMSRHLKIMHSSKKDIDYKRCPQCSFKTFENSRLKRHIKEIHSKEAPQYKCDHCEFTSKFNSCLKRHVETAHINTEPVMCPVCEKQSANIYTLRIHMKLHKTEQEVKMFQCVECPYKTRHSSSFKSHLKRHDSPNKFKCTNCPFRANAKQTLNSHISKFVDSNRSDYKLSCPYCCFRTNQEGSLRIHTTKKHKDEDNEKFWNCGECEFKTLNNRVFKEHLKGHRNYLNFKRASGELGENVKLNIYRECSEYDDASLLQE